MIRTLRERGRRGNTSIAPKNPIGMLSNLRSDMWHGIGILRQIIECATHACRVCVVHTYILWLFSLASVSTFRARLFDSLAASEYNIYIRAYIYSTSRRSWRVDYKYKSKLDLHMRIWDEPKRTIVDNDGSMMPIRRILSIFVAACARLHPNGASRPTFPDHTSTTRNSPPQESKSCTSLRIRRNNVRLSTRANFKFFRTWY